MFSHKNTGNRPESKTTRAFRPFRQVAHQSDVRQCSSVESPGGGTGGEVCRLRPHLVFLVISLRSSGSWRSSTAGTHRRTEQTQNESNIRPKPSFETNKYETWFLPVLPRGPGSPVDPQSPGCPDSPRGPMLPRTPGLPYPAEIKQNAQQTDHATCYVHVS